MIVKEIERIPHVYGDGSDTTTERLATMLYSHVHGDGSSLLDEDIIFPMYMGMVHFTVTCQ